MELQGIQINRTKVCNKASVNSLDINLRKSNCTATNSDNVFTLSMLSSLDILVAMFASMNTNTTTTASNTNTIDSPKTEIQVVMAPGGTQANKHIHHFQQKDESKRLKHCQTHTTSVRK